MCDLIFSINCVWNVCHFKKKYKTRDSNTNKTGSTILKEWTTPDSRNTPSTTNLEEEEIVDAPGNDGNASMPEQVKRPNPWRKMMMKKKWARYDQKYLLGSCDRVSWNVGWREINQQHANNPMFIIKLLSQHVSGIIMPIIRRTRQSITAYGVLHWLRWLWLCGAGS